MRLPFDTLRVTEIVRHGEPIEPEAHINNARVLVMLSSSKHKRM